MEDSHVESTVVVARHDFTLRIPIFLDKVLVVQMWRHDSEVIPMALIARV